MQAQHELTSFVGDLRQSIVSSFVGVQPTEARVSEQQLK